jgi:hypothetical protein
MTITNNCCPIQRVIRGLSRMKGNFHVRFLEEGEGVISPSYSAIYTDNPIRAYPCHPRNPCSIVYNLEGKISNLWHFSSTTEQEAAQ